MDAELTQFFIDQFATLATKEDLKAFATKEDLKDMEARMASKADLANLGAELRAELASKGELAEVDKKVTDIKEIVERLDRRTDEDVRATIKDVYKIKLHLAKHGYKI